MENYLKMSSGSFRKRVLNLMKEYEEDLEGCVSYSFATRFAERRSKNLLIEYVHYLFPRPVKKDILAKGKELINELEKMVVIEHNDGNIIFH